jgi:hypothetical protein
MGRMLHFCRINEQEWARRAPSAVFIAGIGGRCPSQWSRYDRCAQ